METYPLDDQEMDDPVQKGLPPPDRGIRPVGLGDAQEPLPAIDGVARLDLARVLDMLSLGEADALRSPPPAGSKKLSVLDFHFSLSFRSFIGIRGFKRLDLRLEALFLFNQLELSG